MKQFNGMKINIQKFFDKHGARIPQDTFVEMMRKKLDGFDEYEIDDEVYNIIVNAP